MISNSVPARLLKSLRASRHFADQLPSTRPESQPTRRSSVCRSRVTTAILTPRSGLLSAGAEGAAGEGGEWDESDAQAGAALDQAKFRGAGPEGVFVLHGHHGVDGVAAFQGVGADFAEAVAEDFAFFVKALHGSCQVFCRDIGVVAVGVEQRHMIRAKTL